MIKWSFTDMSFVLLESAKNPTCFRISKRTSIPKKRGNEKEFETSLLTVWNRAKELSSVTNYGDGFIS